VSATKLLNRVRSGVYVALLCAIPLGMPSAQADEAWPARPVKLVVGFPPGGPSDAVSRLLAAGLSQQLGQQVIVENRPGAGASIGASVVAKSPPDGYTLLGAHAASVSATAQIREVDYDPRRDLVPIAALSGNFTLLAARKDFPANDIAELKVLAQSAPNKVSCGTAGIGSGSHIACETFAELMGAKILMVHYKGSSQAASDLIGGQIDIFFDPSSLSFVKTGKVKALATRGKGGVRFSELPEVPSFAEQGYPTVTDELWFGLLAPAGTPEGIVERLASAVEKIAADPRTVEPLMMVSQFPSYVGPQALEKRVAEEWDHYGRVIEKYGLREKK
jgi:tripartite-type tricarboxylate transporter receptor subunit TctC